MYVCVCNRVTDTQIRDAAERGVASLDDLCRQLKVASCCGRCRECARQVFESAVADPWEAKPGLAYA